MRIKHSFQYAKQGFGTFGSLLKHSLIPLNVLRDALPTRGTILDLGSGEGMLANLVASTLPGVRVVGIDLNADKIKAANTCAPSNASFQEGDVFTHASGKVQGAIINDVLHHHPPERQKEFLRKTASFLEPGSVLILKEVDANDGADLKWTKFWDTRLYPKDKLNFRTKLEWENMLSEAGFDVVRVHRVRHPWPASRTVFIAKYGNSKSANHKEVTLNVLVTGATGFLGRYVIRHLSNQGLSGRPVNLTALVVCVCVCMCMCMCMCVYVHVYV